MDDLLMLLGAVVVAAAFGRLVGRLIHGYGAPGWPLGSESRESFWRQAMPWPTGIQEDTDIAWHVPRSDPSVPPESTTPSPAPGRAVPPTQPQRRLSRR